MISFQIREFSLFQIRDFRQNHFLQPAATLKHHLQLHSAPEILLQPFKLLSKTRMTTILWVLGPRYGAGSHGIIGQRNRVVSGRLCGACGGFWLGFGI